MRRRAAGRPSRRRRRARRHDGWPSAAGSTAFLRVKGQHQSGHGAVITQRIVAVATGAFGRQGAESAIARRPLVDFAPLQVQIQR